MSHFTFLKSYFSTLYTDARKAERSIDGDPRTSCFYARRSVELWVNWLYEHERRLRRPYQGEQLHTLLTYAEFERLVPRAIRDKAHLIRQMGNQAVHSQSAISKKEALTVVRELFQMLRWLARHYSPEPETIPLSFEVKRVPAALERIQRATRKKLKALEQELAGQDEALRQARQAKDDYEQQLSALTDTIARISAQNATLPELAYQDYSEADTRELLIDVLLREAGWDPYGDKVREYPVQGLPHSKSGTGYVDYVLWGDDGLPLAVVEAKRTAIDAKPKRGGSKPSFMPMRSKR
jgi:type I restriction enzyme R subunit